MDRIYNYLEKKENDSQNGGNGNKIRMDHNKTRYQYGNSECGVYSLNFILRMLRGDSFQSIMEERISDTSVNECRKEYFA